LANAIVALEALQLFYYPHIASCGGCKFTSNPFGREVNRKRPQSLESGRLFVLEAAS
jgi:hypothetical protein